MIYVLAAILALVHPIPFAVALVCAIMSMGVVKEHEKLGVYLFIIAVALATISVKV
jgi:hypothetical protein